uniref:TFIIS N-terminal domain-containing protein n=1 Tax=Aegilops tauschii subsp. strangulata TaxID=200361 RepID=A0A453SSA4_AEGTS
SVCALRRHESERVRVLARGLVSGWRASMKDELAKVRDALHKLDNIDMPQTNEVTVDQQQHISADSDIAKTKASVMKTVAVRKDASGSAAGDRAGHCSEEKMEAAKRKFRQGYQEAEDAKRLRRTQLVQAPKMMQPVRRCTSSMVKKTLAVRSQLHIA